MTKQEVAEQEIEAFKWMTKKGYDRKASKDIAQILVKYHNEQLILSGVVESAYLLKVESKGQVLIVAENIADAMDKLEAKGIKDYAFIRSASIDFI